MLAEVMTATMAQRDSSNELLEFLKSDEPVIVGNTIQNTRSKGICIAIKNEVHGNKAWNNDR